MRLRVYLFFLSLYLVTTAGHIYTIDSFLNYAVTRSLATSGSLEIPRFMMTVEGRGGKHYSKLGIGQSLVGVPLWWLGSALERVGLAGEAFSAYSDEFRIPHEGKLIQAQPQTLIRISNREGARVFFVTLTNAFVTAALCLVFWVALRQFGLTEREAFWRTVILGFATPVWIYARDFFGEPLFALALLATLLALASPWRATWKVRLIVAGISSSVGILTRLTFLPVVVLGGLFLWATDRTREGLKRAITYWMMCLPGALVIAWLNWLRFGGITLTGYHTAFDKGFSIPLIKGLIWNLFSPYRGLLLYAPVVLVVLFGLRRFFQKYRAESLLLVAIVGYMAIVYSKWWAWHGGWCWGPRFLVPTIPLLLMVGFVGLSPLKGWQKATVIGLATLGLVIQLGGVLINYTAAYDYWIKIGKLDWSEAGIQSFFPIGVHLKALAATSPANYDLWLVQASMVSHWALLWGGVWLGVAAMSLRGLFRRST